MLRKRARAWTTPSAITAAFSCSPTRRTCVSFFLSFLDYRRRLGTVLGTCRRQRGPQQRGRFAASRENRNRRSLSLRAARSLPRHSRAITGGRKGAEKRRVKRNTRRRTAGAARTTGEKGRKKKEEKWSDEKERKKERNDDRRRETGKKEIKN